MVLIYVFSRNYVTVSMIMILHIFSFEQKGGIRKVLLSSVFHRISDLRIADSVIFLANLLRREVKVKQFQCKNMTITKTCYGRKVYWSKSNLMFFLHLGHAGFERNSAHADQTPSQFSSLEWIVMICKNRKKLKEVAKLMLWLKFLNAFFARND